MHKVNAKHILSSKNGMNIYRGCLHGCIYCDSRSTIYGMNHPFEDVEVKINAPELLEKALRSKRKKCMIGTGSMSDPYCGIEKELKLTRKCLEIIDGYGFGATVLTKSDLVLRDLDILKKINEKTKCVVQMTLTTYDDDLCRIIEPNVCPTSRRFEVLKILRDNGIPTVVWFTPILPFINDTKENIEGIVSCCIEASVRGILFFGAGVTLRDGDREYFYSCLDRHFPGLKEKYIKTYGMSYVAESIKSDELQRLFVKKCEENGIDHNIDSVFSYLNDFEFKNDQMSLFDI